MESIEQDTEKKNRQLRQYRVKYKLSIVSDIKRFPFQNLGCRGAVHPCRGQGVRVSCGHLCAAEAPTEVTDENQSPDISVVDYKY